jgi:hypothetical protein
MGGFRWIEPFCQSFFPCQTPICVWHGFRWHNSAGRQLTVINKNAGQPGNDIISIINLKILSLCH